MKRLLAMVLSLLIPVASIAGENGYKVVYDGGSLTDTKTGAGIRLFIDSNQIRFVNGATAVATIPAASVTEISYGQDVHRRRHGRVHAGRRSSHRAQQVQEGTLRPTAVLRACSIS